MADLPGGTLCAAVLAVAACGCGPAYEAAAQSPAARPIVAGIGDLPLTASREPPEALEPLEAVEPLPQPALITVVLTDLPATPPTVPEPEPVPPPAGPDAGIADLSHRIENVMSALARLVAESMRMQDSLLRLRLSPKRPDPDDAGAGSP